MNEEQLLDLKEKLNMLAARESTVQWYMNQHNMGMELNDMLIGLLMVLFKEKKITASKLEVAEKALEGALDLAADGYDDNEYGHMKKTEDYKNRFENLSAILQQIRK